MEIPQILQDWIKNLRSKRYRQNQGRLGVIEYANEYKPDLNRSRFCCLGVFCETFIASMDKDSETAIAVRERYGNAYLNSLMTKELNDAFTGKIRDNEVELHKLDHEFVSYCDELYSGLSTDTLYACPGMKIQMILASANDKGMSFEDVADMIEGFCNRYFADK